jgi:(p)ppGpp synthase/HD superfamily hydrolase
VRRGVRLPYLTHPPNVAIILTRYGRNDDTVIAGILLNVVKDYVADGLMPEMISERLGEKFGSAVVDTLLAALPRRTDSNGVELSLEERRGEAIAMLAQMPEAARWVVAADALHEAATLLADLRRTIDPAVVWERRGGRRNLAWYREVVHGLRNANFTAPIVDELQDAVDALEAAR